MAVVDEHRRTPSDDEVVSALRAHGTDYQPDIELIRQRIVAGPRAGRPAATRSSTLHERQSRVSVLLSTAAVLLVVGGVIAVVRVPGDGGPASTQAVPAVRTVSESVSPVPTTSTAVGSAVSATSAPSPSSKTSAPVTSGAPDRPVARDNARRPTAPSSVAGPLPRSMPTVDLQSPPLLDWLVVGSRADLKQVRAKGAGAVTALTVDQPTPATSSVGRYRVSWSGGSPEQDRDGATRWLGTDGEAGLTVRVAPSTVARSIVLYTGALDVTATLSVKGQGISSTRTAVGSSTGAVRSFVVTVRLPPSPGPVTMALTGVANGPQPTVYLAAVTAARAS